MKVIVIHNRKGGMGKTVISYFGTCSADWTYNTARKRGIGNVNGPPMIAF